MNNDSVLERLVDLIAYPLMCGLLMVSLVGWVILLRRLYNYRNQKKLQQSSMGSGDQGLHLSAILTRKNARFDFFIKLILWVSLFVGVYLIIRVFGVVLTTAALVFVACMYKAEDKSKYILALKVGLGLVFFLAVGLYLFFLGIDWPTH